MVFGNPGRSEGFKIRWRKIHFRRPVERRQRGLDRFMVRPPFGPAGGQHAFQPPPIRTQALEVLGCEAKHGVLVPYSFRLRQGLPFLHWLQKLGI